MQCPRCRFKAKTRANYDNWSQDMLDQLMLRVWQHVEALHGNMSWEDVEQFPLECWSDSWASQFALPAALLPAGDDDGGHRRRGNEPIRSRSRSRSQPFFVDVDARPETPPRRGPRSFDEARAMIAQAIEQLDRTSEQLDRTSGAVRATREALRGLLNEPREGARRRRRR